MGQIRLQFIHISYCISSLTDTVTLPKESQRTIQASSKLIYCLEVLHQALLHKGHRGECFFGKSYRSEDSMLPINVALEAHVIKLVPLFTA